MAWVHGEGRVEGLVSDAVLEVNRSITGHGEGHRRAVGEGEGGEGEGGERGEGW